MNMKNLPVAIAYMIVSLIVVVAIFVPFVNTATDNTTTYTNSGTVLLSPVSDGETVTGSIDFTNEVVTVNDQVQSLDYPKERSAVIFAENCMIGYNNSSGTMNPAIDYWDGTTTGHLTSSSGITFIEFTVLADHSITVTYTVDSDPVTISIPSNDWILVKDDNGTFVECTRNKGGTVYTDSIDNIYAGSWTFVNSYQFGVKGDVATVNGSPATVVWDSEPVMEGVIGVDIGYTVQNSYVEFTKTDDTVSTTNIQTVVVPVEVVGNTESNIIINTMLSVLPIIAVIGLLISIALYFKRT